MTDYESLAVAWKTALIQELRGAGQLRRLLHAKPDLSGKETATADLVASSISQGTSFTAESIASTGRLVRVGPAAGPAIALRAELDGLPIQELTEVDFASHNGNMHACGHDVHLAALAAVCRAARLVNLPFALLAILQPREEAPPSGARDIVRTGRLLSHDVRAIIAAHLQPRVEAGTVALDSDIVNAAHDEVRVVVYGHGGHGAYPHLSSNPVPAVCRIVLAFHELVRSSIDPMHPVVLTMTQLGGSGAANVIPNTATAGGTLRTMVRSDLETIRPLMRRIGEQIADAHGCRCEVVHTECEPVLVNDAGLVVQARRWFPTLGIEIAAPFRSCASDDFSWYGSAIPSIMMFVGTGDEDGARTLHDPRFLPLDRRIGEVAHSLIAGYMGAAEQIGSC